MDNCKSCNGNGWHYAGDGVMYECHPCNSTGLNQSSTKVLTENSFSQVQEAVNEPANPFLALRKLMRRNKK